MNAGAAFLDSGDLAGDVGGGGEGDASIATSSSRGSPSSSSSLPPARVAVKLPFAARLQDSVSAAGSRAGRARRRRYRPSIWLVRRPQSALRATACKPSRTHTEQRGVGEVESTSGSRTVSIGDYIFEV